MEKENKTGIQELKNEAVEEAMKAFLADKTNQTMANLMAVMRDARFLVPADFPPDVKKQVIEKAKRGEKVDTKIAPRMLPIIVQNQNGEHFAPAYTSIEQMKTNAKYPAILNVTIDELLRIGSAPQLNLKGIILNPDTDKIKMSRAQFELFARRTCEWGIIPGAVHKEKAEFMKKLEEQQGRFMAALYRQPYGDKIPFPYSEKDFDIMILDIDEETCVASIELPKQNLAPHMAASMYIVWNPKNDEMHYFTIEQRPQGEENVLCGFGENGKREELQTAPAAGNEISAVLDLVREEKEEA